MATIYGWAGQILRVDLTAGTCTAYPTNAFPVTDYTSGGTVTVDMTQYIGGRGIGYAIMAYEVPPGTAALSAANRLIFGVGPITGSGSPSSGRTSITSLHSMHKDDLVDGGQMGGHWGPELKYAGYDAIVIQGASANPVWLCIQDGQATLQDASMLWGQGIYYSTNYIVNEMGPEAHVACIGPWSENLVHLSAVYCDRSHRGGGQAAVMGFKNLKAIGVRGTGAVNIATDKVTWKKLINNYLSMMGCNNQGVVAKTLQPWSEYSPGGTRWSGAPGVLWGAANPPRNLGNCPDAEHPMFDAPTPNNKIGLRTQKGYNDFADEGMKRTVKMDGCHACPIRCHIAADHPQLLNYGITRYNMNTCLGNSGGTNALYTNTAGADPTQYPMLLTYAANSIDDDYGHWSDYSATQAATKWLINARIPNPNGGANIPLLQKYLSDADWKMLTATSIWNSGIPPMGPAGYAVAAVAVTNGSAVVTGVGTTSVPAGPTWNAANQVTAGSVIAISGATYTIQSVDSTTKITLTTPYAGDTGSGLSYVINLTTSGYSAGTVAVTTGSAVVTGTKTTWNANNQATPGAIIVLAGVSYVILSVDSTTQITLTANYAGATATGVSYVINKTTASKSLLDNGDPRFIQFWDPYVAQNTAYATPVTNSFGQKAYGSLGYYYGIGVDRLARGDSRTGFPGWPELQAQMQISSSIAIFHMSANKHHSIESNGLVGALINFFQRNRDPNNHTWQCFYTNGLPDSLKQAICQELTTQNASIFNAPDESASGAWAYWSSSNGGSTEDAVNLARVALAVQCVVNMELHNALTQCNYTLPVWASPLKSRNYRGDPSLEAQTFEAITGQSLMTLCKAVTGYNAYSPALGGEPASPTPQMALETLALRLYTLFRCLTAIGMQQANPDSVYSPVAALPAPTTWNQYTPLALAVPASYQVGPTGNPGDGNNLRWSHDYAYPWNYGTVNGPGTPVTPSSSGSASTYLDVSGTGNTEAAKSMAYDMLGWDRASGLPRQATLNALGLSFIIPKMQAVGIVVPA